MLCNLIYFIFNIFSGNDQSSIVHIYQTIKILIFADIHVMATH